MRNRKHRLRVEKPSENIAWGEIVNQAMRLQQAGNYEQAYALFSKALIATPDNASLLQVMGFLALEMGNFVSASVHLLEAVRIDKENSAVWRLLAQAYKMMGKFELSLSCLLNAVQLSPDDAELNFNIGNLFSDLNQSEHALKHYLRALELKPDLASARFAVVRAHLSILHKSIEDMNKKRQDLIAALSELEKYAQEDAAQRRKLADGCGNSSLYFLAPYPEPNKEIQAVWGGVCQKAMEARYPQWSGEMRSRYKGGRRIRVGFVGAHFYRHSVWKIPLRGWIEEIDKTKFETYGYYLGSKVDDCTEAAKKSLDHFMMATQPMERWAQKIYADNIDVLIYPEIGMDMLTHRLAMLRLAPVQALTLGHPDTTGLSTMDYYLSSDLMEPEDGDEHYTEKLIRLPNLCCHYKPLDVPKGSLPRSQIGVAEDEPLLLCCQTICKYIPQNDELLMRIAKRIPKAKFVFIAGKAQDLADFLKERLKRACMAEGVDFSRFVFVEHLDSARFNALLSMSDVFLDTLGWSGNNSTTEALAQGLPVVTLAGKTMRARHSYGILRMIGVEDTIASSLDDYIELVAKLVEDKSFAKEVREKIQKNLPQLFEDKETIKGLEEFLEKVVLG